MMSAFMMHDSIILRRRGRVSNNDIDCKELSLLRVSSCCSFTFAAPCIFVVNPSCIAAGPCSWNQGLAGIAYNVTHTATRQLKLDY